TLKRALRRSVQNDRSQAVLHLALGELRLAQQQPAAAYQHLLTVLDLAPNSPQAIRAQSALKVLTQRGELLNQRWL
nr:hypothetical protein [Myxococcales bacterium]